MTPSLSLGDLLRRGLEAGPDRVAIFDSERGFTFAQLEELSNRVASRISSFLRIAPGERIVVIGEKRLEAIIIVLGIWKSGAIYVPVDPANAPERTAHILSRIRPALIVSSRACLSATASFEPRVPRLSYEDIHGLEPSAPTASTPVPPSTAGMIIHTSGSTGYPKGSVLSRASIVTYFENHNLFLSFDPSSRSMSNGPLHFDVSIQDTFLPLSFGASVLFHDGLFVSSRILDAIRAHRVTHLIAVSSVLELVSNDTEKLSAMGETSLRTVVTGGEVCDPKLINLWLRSVPGLRVLYGYGPTECNSLCMTYEITTPDPGRAAPFPIGKPFPGMKVVLLDDQEQVIDGSHVTGVLAIAGPQLMTGYWEDPQQTESALRVIGGETFYISGDRCHRDEDGNFHFAGRNDTEVKIRGRRINLNEIRNALLSHEAVKFAAVDTLAVEAGTRIIAFVQIEDDAFVEATLQEALRQRVPSYMFPSHICISRHAERTSTGKILEKAALRRAAESIRLNSREKYLWLDVEEVTHGA